MMSCTAAIRQMPQVPYLSSRKPIFYRLFRADPVAVRSALMALRELLARSADEDAVNRLELALAEVLNNICQHGAGEPAARPASSRQLAPMVHLCVARHVGGIACAITDDGIPLPIALLPPANRPEPVQDHDICDDPDLLPEGGFGWHLIRDLTYSLCYFREGRRNLLAFTVPLGEAYRINCLPGQFSPNCRG